MRLVIIVVLVSVAEADIGVDGDVTFELITIAGSAHVVRGFRSRGHYDTLHQAAPGAAHTAAPALRCVYQYPEHEQVDDLLSNMMNQLTKVFVRVHVLLTEDVRRKTGTRFLVIHEKRTDFFDHIFGNMTREYQNVYNKTSNRANRAEKHKDPCKNQEEIKRIWRDLLVNSLATFRRAAAHCIEEHLKLLNIDNDPRIRTRLGEFLLREVAKVRANQLGVLCDNFQLCYNELL